MTSTEPRLTLPGVALAAAIWIGFVAFKYLAPQFSASAPFADGLSLYVLICFFAFVTNGYLFSSFLRFKLGLLVLSLLAVLLVEALMISVIWWNRLPPAG